MRLLFLLLMLPFALCAQTGPKVLIVAPHAVSLNSQVVSALRNKGIKPDSLVNNARLVFGPMAKNILTDYQVKVLGLDVNENFIPVLADRETTVKVKKRRLLTKKEYVVNRKVKYKGVNVGASEKLVLQDVAKTFDYDYVVFVSYFEIGKPKGLNLALKPLSSFGVHYEVYNKDLAFLTGNYVYDDLSVTPTMESSVLFHYVKLSAENVYRLVAPILN